MNKSKLIARSRSYSSYVALERVIAHAYVLCLTFRMLLPFRPFMASFHGAANYLDFILHLLGITIYLFANHGQIEFYYDLRTCTFLTVLKTIIWLNISSLLMAAIIQHQYGDYAGESAFSGIIGMEIYFFQYALMIAYNMRVFSLFSREELANMLDRLCAFLLLLGWYQMFMYRFGGIFVDIMERVDFCGILHPDLTMWKLSLTGSEGASAGVITGVLVVPWLLTRILHDRGKVSAAISLLLWLPVILYMHSSSAYFIIAAAVIAYILLQTTNTRSKRTQLAIIFFSLVAAMAILFIGMDSVVEWILSLFPSDFNVRYLALEKFHDLDNQSTAARLVPFITNWGAFTEHPVFGVGNGLQGYFFTKYYPDWAIRTIGIGPRSDYARALRTINNGAIFFPSLLSGYGIVGCAVIINCIREVKRLFHAQKDSLWIFRSLFLISLAAIIITGLQADFAGNYLIWFMLSFPFYRPLDARN